MIFPDVSVEKWCRKYNGLELKTSKCWACRQPRTTTIPFIEQGWAGLRAPQCPCGRNKGSFSVRVSTDGQSDALISRLFDY
jgi:hypothetical protein